jgi:excinuclease UvrABC nuclease subunit
MYRISNEKMLSSLCKKISKIDYFEDIASAKSYLSSSDNQTINKLTSDIEKASESFNLKKQQKFEID